ncbi:MAG TPA: S28 family serine protease, partial [Kofleriaceae bacterium]|nr:S28 family serine protease [Kofleriaceae bacterium]
MRTCARAIAFAAAAATALAACSGDDDGGPGGPGAPGDLVEALEDIPGMLVAEQPIDPPYRFFHLLYEQPVDHGDPDGARFQQRITLLHVDPEAPTILHTTGYYLYEEPFAAEITYLTGGNQVHVEQRYFEPSRPEPADWSLLTIEQAAADHHRIVEALRPLYPGPWVATGASKGGMTSVYHRRFYPDDIDVTIAYVAPHSLAAEDPRYEPFVDEIGDPACAAALRAAQAEALGRRGALEAMAGELAAAEGYTFDRLGLARAVEFAAVESRFTFWQYGGADGCPQVPTAMSSDAEVFAWLEEIVGIG